MDILLKITWDGDAPGLAEHRLSVATFGDPMNLLLAALRRIATNIVGDAIGASEHTIAGRYADAARQLDIEIVQIGEGGSTEVSALFTFRPLPSAPELFGDLSERAGIELLESLEQESKGHLRHAGVRKYLQSLPPTVRRQVYSLHDPQGRVLREPVTIGEMNLPEVPPDLPYLAQFVGSIIGVGFEPGKTEIRLRTHTGSHINLVANSEQVDIALRLRASTVRVLAVMSKPSRVLRIEQEDAPVFQATTAQIETYIFDRWGELLRRLAR